MNKALLMLVFLTSTTSAYTADAAENAATPTVTIRNKTTSEIDIYERQKIIVKALAPAQITTVESTNQLAIQASSVRCWHSPVFIDPSDLQKERTFKLSSTQYGFVLE